jgi:hypothetical protein
MSLDLLLSRLEKVKGRNGSYVACCPAHKDKSPSLAIRESDGKIILHCFAGCQVPNIMESLGMDMNDLFPPTESKYTSHPKVKFYAVDMLRVLHLEANIVMVSAFNMSKGVELSNDDLDRLKIAYERIDTAMESVNG